MFLATQTYIPGQFGNLNLDPCDKCNKAGTSVFVVNSNGYKLCSMCIRQSLIERLHESGLDHYESQILKIAYDLVLISCGVLPATPNARLIASHNLRLDAQVDEN